MIDKNPAPIKPELYLVRRLAHKIWETVDLEKTNEEAGKQAWFHLRAALFSCCAPWPPNPSDYLYDIFNALVQETAACAPTPSKDECLHRVILFITSPLAQTNKAHQTAKNKHEEMIQAVKKLALHHTPPAIPTAAFMEEVFKSAQRTWINNIVQQSLTPADPSKNQNDVDLSTMLNVLPFSKCDTLINRAVQFKLDSLDIEHSILEKENQKNDDLFLHFDNQLKTLFAFTRTAREHMFEDMLSLENQIQSFTPNPSIQQKQIQNASYEKILSLASNILNPVHNTDFLSILARYERYLDPPSHHDAWYWFDRLSRLSAVRLAVSAMPQMGRRLILNVIEQDEKVWAREMRWGQHSKITSACCSAPSKFVTDFRMDQIRRNLSGVNNFNSVQMVQDALRFYKKASSTSFWAHPPATPLSTVPKNIAKHSTFW